MFRKMLVCTDLSPASDALIQCVEELRTIGMQEVVLTHVRFMAATPGVEEVVLEESSPSLQGQRAYLEERGIRVSVAMPCGLPPQAIAETAEKHDVSAIMIGSSGKGILRAAALGSVSAQLLQRMRRPVLLARIALLDDGRCESVCARMFSRLLFPTDFSETAERTMEYLGKITQDTRCSVNVTCARRVMDRGIPILLTGETGTGKELFARAIHDASQRAARPFIALNCASIPESLIESELFGYRQGAFTGAHVKGMRGKILQSDGGTLFLDEIGDMPLSLQTRLLRVLAEREVLPLGSELPLKVDLNVICATLRNLEELVDTGRFREDLYYRLNGITITLPPLRQREDRALLIRSMISAERDNGCAGISPEAFEALLGHPWPGNIRQLQNVIRCSLAVSESGLIGLEDLPLADVRGQAPLTPLPPPPPGAASPPEVPFDEYGVMLHMLVRHEWNLSRVSRELGISRPTLYKKMERYAIVPPHAFERKRR